MRPQTTSEQSVGIQMVAAGIFGGGAAMWTFSIMHAITAIFPNMVLFGRVGIILIFRRVYQLHKWIELWNTMRIPDEIYRDAFLRHFESAIKEFDEKRDA